MIKKITLLVLLALAYTGNAQLTENFEGGTFPPTGWTSFIGANGYGTTDRVWQSHTVSGVNTTAVCLGDSEEDIPAGETAEDWLVTPQFTVDGATPVLQFDSTDFNLGDFGSIYTVRVSTASQTTYTEFAIIATQTEAEISHSQEEDLTGNRYRVDLSNYSGQAIYVAFVLEQRYGDLWRIDNIDMTAPLTCGTPEFLTASNVTTTSFDVSWGVNDEGSAPGFYNIEYGPKGFAQGSGTALTTSSTSISFDTLEEATGYDVYVQSDCSGDGQSIWVGPITIYTQYDVVCGTLNLSNNIENGVPCTAPQITAQDIIVPINTIFSLTKIVPQVLMNPGVTATVDITIYDDASGLPGAVVSTQTSIVPTSSESRGSNFGLESNALELDLTPVDLINESTSDTKSFWIGISVTTSDGTNAYWENTSASIIGEDEAIFNGTDPYIHPVDLDASNIARDGVYAFVASCTTATVNDDLLSSVSIYPTTVTNTFTIDNGSGIALTKLSLYDVNGRMVLTQNLDNLLGRKTISMSNLSAGMYFVELRSANAKTVKKMIKL